VWTLYLENHEVFTKALSSLRAAGTVVDEDTAQDLIHAFLVERAPAALATFQPERGELKGWLFVVFKRFVVGGLRERSRQQRLMTKLSNRGGDPTEVSPDETPSLDLEALRAAVNDLPADEREAIFALLASPTGTIRAVARALGASRWRTSALITAAFAKLTQKLVLPATHVPEAPTTRPPAVET
jgi:RNA polymerase sigma factor (sigma-70 family)